MDLHVSVLTIGQIAKAAGVTTPTVRYYEEIGLLPKAGRTSAGQRIYAESELERLIFIRRCRDFGFSIDQVRVLAGLAISLREDCSQVRDMAHAHLSEVRQKLAELQRLEASLEAFANHCDTACAGGPGRDCVVFEDLKARPGCC